MVITQIIIDDKKEKQEFEISCYILRREDATDREYDLAKVFQDFTEKLSKDLAEKLKCRLEQEFIKD